MNLFEISYKEKNELFHHIQYLFDVPVYGVYGLSSR